jgi:cell division septum initiation protein DivIVA
LTTAWFDQQQRLSPEELATARFPLSRLGRRGYEEEPVNSFLRSVQAEFVRLVNERASLWAEVQRLRRRILGEAGEVDGDPKAVLFGESDAHGPAVWMPSAAQVTAGRYAADAEANGSRITEEARLRHAHIMLAQQHSDMILEDAEARAREAAVCALNFPAPPQTDREQQAAQAELAYLRAYTEGILRGIEEWERKEGSFQEAAPGPADHRSIGR